MKFGRIVLQVNTHRLEEVEFPYDTYFQNCGHDFRPPLTAVYVAACAGCPLSRRARVPYRLAVRAIVPDP